MLYRVAAVDSLLNKVQESMGRPLPGQTNCRGADPGESPLLPHWSEGPLALWRLSASI